VERHPCSKLGERAQRRVHQHPTAAISRHAEPLPIDDGERLEIPERIADVSQDFAVVEALGVA
jgi:hypothetical protein